METRDAVITAARPEGKRSRATAKSGWSDITRAPTASTASGFLSRQGQDQVDVVDHQVEHHRDIQAARPEWRGAHGLPGQRGVAARRGQHGAEGGREALDMADLQHPAPRGGERPALRLSSVAERLLDEQVPPASSAAAERRSGSGSARRRSPHSAAAMASADRQGGRRLGGDGRGARRVGIVHATRRMPPPFAAFSAWKRPKCPTPSTATRSHANPPARRRAHRRHPGLASAHPPRIFPRQPG
jgi:hypothetical protein